MPYPGSYGPEAGQLGPVQARMQEIMQRRPAPGPGPFGGEVAMKGQGGFQALPEATMARTPPPPAAPPRAMARPMAGASNPYGPARPRAENAGNRIATRRMANQLMLGGGRRR